MDLRFRTAIEPGAGGNAVGIVPVRRRAAGRIVFVITGLDCGGAEMMLLRLLAGVDRAEICPVVISLHGAGFISSALNDLEIPVHELNWRNVIQAPLVIKALRDAIGGFAPDLIQGWMLHGSLAAHLVNLASPRRVPVLWNMRHSLHDLDNERVTTKAIIRLLRVLSPGSARIIYNSQTVARQHERIGFDRSRTVVIPNGFDCARFQPWPERRAIVRAALQVPEGTALIGLVGRVHPSKDHGTFLEAARQLLSMGCPAHFMLVGRGTDGPDITDQIAALSLQGKVHSLGERLDIPEILSAFDIATSSSRAEAFPNAVGEAMACGVPCVVTDVGDSAWLVGGTGRIVPRADPIALSDAWLELLSLAPGTLGELGQAARARIAECFSIEGVVGQYESLYREVLHG